MEFISGDERRRINGIYLMIQSLSLTFIQMLLEHAVGNHVREAVGKGRVSKPAILLF